MSRIVEVPLEAVVPDGPDVLRAMGVPPDVEPSKQVLRVLERSLRTYRETAAPRGIVEHVDRDSFALIYRGEGDNPAPSPLETIFPRAELLTLFVVTLGDALTARIRSLFDENDLAMGATLDAVASEGTELAAAFLERNVEAAALSEGAVARDARALRYSPGYCGWNVTGQRALFRALAPEAIGVRLLESCLMEPLKSISGVVVTGPRKIHMFDADFPCCSECRTRECRDRIRALRDRPEP